MDYYLEPFKKYAVFSGRATRKEFWLFLLINWFILLVLVLLSGSPKITDSPIAFLYQLSVFLPSISLGVRRMHDVNENGWFLLIPIVNFVLACTAGTNGDNKYGSAPTSPTSDTLNVQNIRNKNIIICGRCKKREGRWWDHLCGYCRNMPTSKQEALEYEKVNGAKDILDFNLKTNGTPTEEDTHTDSKGNSLQ
jgi:uncharacterized membrane protein YhaH (DUF805 family)